MGKVLLIDDSEVLRMEVREMLESGGHEVTEASNGADGLSKANEIRDIEIIITDLNMPEMDGITMVKKIREIADYKETPVFMLTTESSKELKLLGKEAGVMLWMVKPVSEKKVLAAVDKILEMKRTDKK